MYEEIRATILKNYEKRGKIISEKSVDKYLLDIKKIQSLLGDMGVSRLNASPHLLTYYDNHEALARLSWAHYAVGASVSVELGCTINFVTMMDQEVGIATFAPLYDVVFEHLWECFPDHPSTIMRGRTIYITTYHGCCYPVVNIPQSLEAAAGEPWFPP